ncbi:MAG: hypothetical protein ACTTKN_04545 [Phocaeicola sp.]|uniref:hypothetical protein n=1 Tax=Phocaeicola TaxID=909656 RepID=UPI00234E89E0|nr:hypothetical protein [Phocaeicola oris]MCE2615608.1 hypothetical protein [Phocaeicola oris]
MIKILKYILFLIILYLFVFQSIFDKYIYVGIEFLISILFFKKYINAFYQKFKIEIILFSLIILYSLMLDLVGGKVVYLDRFLACFIQGLFFSFLLTCYINKNKYLYNNFDNLLLAICFIATSITILAILDPSFDDIIKSFTPEQDEFYENHTLSNEFRYRGFGLSENLSFTYPYVLSIIGGYVIIKRLNIVTIFLLPMIFIAIIFNARIGFIPIIGALLYIVVKNITNIKKIIILCFFVIGITALVPFISNSDSVFNNSWGLSFFTEINDGLQGKSSHTLDILLGEMIIIPDDNIISLLFGTGKSIYTEARNNSDIGYILQLNYGGVFLLTLILCYMLYTSRRFYKIFHFKHWFTFIYIISIFVLNFKGFYFASTPGFRFMSLLYIFYIVNYKKQLINSKIK